VGSVENAERRESEKKDHYTILSLSWTGENSHQSRSRINHIQLILRWVGVRSQLIALYESLEIQKFTGFKNRQLQSTAFWIAIPKPGLCQAQKSRGKCLNLTNIE